MPPLPLRIDVVWLWSHDGEYAALCEFTDREGRDLKLFRRRA